MVIHAQLWTSFSHPALWPVSISEAALLSLSFWELAKVKLLIFSTEYGLTLSLKYFILDEACKNIRLQPRTCRSAVFDGGTSYSSSSFSWLLFVLGMCAVFFEPTGFTKDALWHLRFFSLYSFYAYCCLLVTWHSGKSNCLITTVLAHMLTMASSGRVVIDPLPLSCFEHYKFL